jgi:hypothetical protein
MIRLKHQEIKRRQKRKKEKLRAKGLLKTAVPTAAGAKPQS